MSRLKSTCLIDILHICYVTRLPSSLLHLVIPLFPSLVIWVFLATWMSFVTLLSTLFPIFQSYFTEPDLLALYNTSQELRKLIDQHEMHTAQLALLHAQTHTRENGSPQIGVEERIWAAGIGVGRWRDVSFCDLGTLFLEPNTSSMHS